LFKRLSDFHPFPTVAAVGWIEQSETHHPAAGVVMGFGYHLYPSYAGYAGLYAFPSTLTTMAFVHSSLRWFETRT
jgi:hypothetical protein